MSFGGTGIGGGYTDFSFKVMCSIGSSSGVTDFGRGVGAGARARAGSGRVGVAGSSAEVIDFERGAGAGAGSGRVGVAM